MNIVIVEDEPVVAARLERLVAELAPGAGVRRFRRLDEALEGLEAQPADALLLDLNLQGEDGFELLARAAAGPAQTIVVSANIDRAVEAFAWGVLDFVPKPFDRERLALALERLRGSGARSCCTRLVVRHAGALEVVPVEAIVAIHGSGNYAEIELAGGGRRLHEKTLDALERILPERFVRVHRSHILDTRAIERLRSLPGSRYRAEMTAGGSWPVSRRRVRQLRAAIRRA